MTARASTILRARLTALLELRGYSVTGIARAMDKSHTWLLRKLDTSQATVRPLTVDDLDDVLGFLGLDADAMLAPVLLPGDRELLAFLGTAGSVAYGGGATVEDVAAVFAQGQAALERLAAQGLAEHPDTDTDTDKGPSPEPARYQLTPLGASAL